jgi:hypothetical protein
MSLSSACSQSDFLSFPALDAKIDDGLQIVAKDWKALLPCLLEMNRGLRAPGRRSDLRKGAPPGLTWTEWVKSKRGHLGRSNAECRHNLAQNCVMNHSRYYPARQWKSLQTT